MPSDVGGSLPPGSITFGGSNNRRNQPNNSRRPGPVTTQLTDHAPLPHQSTPYHYPPTASSYGQRPAFYGGGQYTMSPPPPTMAHFSYPHGHGFQVPPDPGMISQNIHGNYQPMLSAPYPYQHQQRHSPESNTPSHSQAGFSHPNLYPPQHQHGNSSPSPTFTNPGQFQSLRYSPIPHSPQYAGYQAPYPYQSPQYSYPRPFSSTDADSQRGWWYLPVAAHQPQYDSTPPPPSYAAGPFTMAYSPVSHQPQQQEMERLGSNSPAHIYPNPSSPPLPPPQSHVPRTSFNPSQPPAPSSAPPSPAPTPPDPSPKPAAGRKPYHPSPPAHRSEWVMWTGNVPHDATHDELWRFFTQKPPTPPASAQPPPLPSHNSSSTTPNRPSSPSSSSEKWNSGVISIFLISRSSCAFVNYENSSTLEFAIRRFNGLPLRPHDPRCPRLVCRVRKKDDDLRAGVGGQRGVGMHMKYVKELNMKQTQNCGEEDSISSASSALTSEESSDNPIAHAGGVDGVSGTVVKRLIPRTSGGGHSNSSGSYASTNSSVLTRYFPKRFFILKSLSQYDLDLSVEKGLWATQKHNEGILDQAYRTSSEVYLIFGVNKSGEFYGYARMASAVKGEHRVSWGPRADSASSVSTRSSLSPVAGRGSVQADTIYEEPAIPTASSNQFFTDHLVEESPQPFSGGPGTTSSSINFVTAAVEQRSAPAELKDPHRKITLQTPAMKFSLDHEKLEKTHRAASIPAIVQRDFQLDEEAPVRAMKHPDKSSSEGSSPSPPAGGQKGIPDGVTDSEGKGRGKQPEPRSVLLPTLSPSQESPPPTPPLRISPRVSKDKDREREDTWGDSFKVDWVCTDRLPFYRTRHIRNPWNHDREIKVSRDGTELEPGVGQQLLDEWEKFVREKEKEKGKEGGSLVDGIDGIEGDDAAVEGKPEPAPSAVGSSTRKSVGKRNG
ncbi:hypothetical protein L218DRAFT_1001634 [Marasmius fiardii PR-910]|nr:hypothetical protein L218DRAFT_1001634 [Marasmius fiardii PR-910]